MKPVFANAKAKVSKKKPMAEVKNDVAEAKIKYPMGVISAPN